MKKIAKLSNLGGKREFKMEKMIEISSLGGKREFKMEKMVKISNLRKKSEFKMEKTVEISILELGCKYPLTITISHNKKKKRIAESNLKIVVSEKSILLNYPKFHMIGEKI